MRWKSCSEVRRGCEGLALEVEWCVRGSEEPAGVGWVCLVGPGCVRCATGQGCRATTMTPVVQSICRERTEDRGLLCPASAGEPPVQQQQRHCLTGSCPADPGLASRATAHTCQACLTTARMLAEGAVVRSSSAGSTVPGCSSARRPRHSATTLRHSSSLSTAPSSRPSTCTRMLRVQLPGNNGGL